MRTLRGALGATSILHKNAPSFQSKNTTQSGPFSATQAPPKRPSDEEMGAFQKRTRPEDTYSEELFDAVRANRMDGAATNVDGASLKDYVTKNCTESTRMIKLAIKR